MEVVDLVDPAVVLVAVLVVHLVHPRVAVVPAVVHPAVHVVRMYQRIVVPVPLDVVLLLDAVGEGKPTKTFTKLSF